MTKATQVGGGQHDVRAYRDRLLDVVARLQGEIRDLRSENARLRSNNGKLAAQLGRQQQSDA